VEVALPVCGHPADRTRCRLVNGMVRRRRQRGTEGVVLGLEVPEPVLARFEASDHRVASRLRVRGRVLGRRGVTTTDAAALRAGNARNPNEVRSWAVRAGQALAHEPVLTGAVHRLSDGDETVSAAFRLLLAAPEEHKRALARLFHGLRRAALD